MYVCVYIYIYIYMCRERERERQREREILPCAKSCYPNASSRQHATPKVIIQDVAEQLEGLDDTTTSCSMCTQPFCNKVAQEGNTTYDTPLCKKLSKCLFKTTCYTRSHHPIRGGVAEQPTPDSADYYAHFPLRNW